MPRRARLALLSRSPTFHRGPAVARPDPDETGENETGEGGDAGPADEVVVLNEDVERAGGEAVDDAGGVGSEPDIRVVPFAGAENERGGEQ